MLTVRSTEPPDKERQCLCIYQALMEQMCNSCNARRFCIHKYLFSCMYKCVHLFSFPNNNCWQRGYFIKLWERCENDGSVPKTLPWGSFWVAHRLYQLLQQYPPTFTSSTFSSSPAGITVIENVATNSFKIELEVQNARDSLLPEPWKNIGWRLGSVSAAAGPPGPHYLWV